MEHPHHPQHFPYPMAPMDPQNMASDSGAFRLQGASSSSSNDVKDDGVGWQRSVVQVELTAVAWGCNL